MSLISTKNLVAPLTNMVHMITILLIAITFAVLRFSGASISLQSSSAPTIDSRTNTPIVAPVDPGQQTAQPQRAPAPWGQRDNSKQPPAQKKGGLDDIEKALGL